MQLPLGAQTALETNKGKKTNPRKRASHVGGVLLER
jgi:hypothetical protein